MSVDLRDLEQTRDAHAPLSSFQCVSCGYGASTASEPERCPMCGGGTWEHADWRPFTRSRLD
jgi:rubrerythrin